MIVPNEGIRDLALILEWRGGSYTDEVLYVLGHGYLVLFLKALCTLGLLMEFSKDHFWVREKKTNSFVCYVNFKDGSYRMEEKL